MLQLPRGNLICQVDEVLLKSFLCSLFFPHPPLFFFCFTLKSTFLFSLIPQHSLPTYHFQASLSHLFPVFNSHPISKSWVKHTVKHTVCTFWGSHTSSFLKQNSSPLLFPIDKTDDELEMTMVCHRPEGLEQLEAQTNFTKQELQILYRGFKNVSTHQDIVIFKNAVILKYTLLPKLCSILF